MANGDPQCAVCGKYLVNSCDHQGNHICNVVRATFQYIVTAISPIGNQPMTISDKSIEAAKMVLVPVEPTPAMCTASALALDKEKQLMGFNVQDPKAFKPHEKHAIRYRAMIQNYLAAERAQGRDWEAELDSARLIENQLLEALRPMAERAKSFNDGPDGVWALHAKAGEYNVKEARCAATAYAALVDKGTQGRDWQAIEKLLPEIDDRLSRYSCACSKSCETGEYAEPCHHYKTTQLRARLRAEMGKE